MNKKFLVWAWQNPTEGEMVTWLGCHAVKWQQGDEPTMAFTELPHLTDEEHEAILAIIDVAYERGRREEQEESYAEQVAIEQRGEFE